MGRIEYEGPVTQGAHRALKEQIFLIRLHEVLAKARIGKIGNGGICVFMTTFCNVCSQVISVVTHSLTNNLLLHTHSLITSDTSSYSALASPEFELSSGATSSSPTKSCKLDTSSSPTKSCT